MQGRLLRRDFAALLQIGAVGGVFAPLQQVQVIRFILGWLIVQQRICHKSGTRSDDHRLPPGHGFLSRMVHLQP